MKQLIASYTADQQEALRALGIDLKTLPKHAPTLQTTQGPWVLPANNVTMADNTANTPPAPVSAPAPKLSFPAVQPPTKKQKVQLPGPSRVPLKAAAPGPEVQPPATGKITTAELNAAITAAISENFVVTDHRIHQAGAELVAAAQAMEQHLTTAMSLLGSYDQNTLPRAEELWQEITDRQYVSTIARAHAVFGSDTGAKVLIPRTSLPGTDQGASK